MTPYSESTEKFLRKFYKALSEKDRRRYAGVEAQKLGHGGITYIAKLLGCSQSTISTGIEELKKLPEESGYDSRVRRPGGGRKRYEKSHPDIDEAFLSVIKDNTAGDPMQEKVLWTNLTQQQIAERLGEEHGIEVSETVVKQLLKKHDFTRRKAKKSLSERSGAPQRAVRTDCCSEGRVSGSWQSCREYGHQEEGEDR